MGALDMGLTNDELPDIVSRWREANRRIRELWYSMEAAALQVITEGGSAGVNGLVLAREYDLEHGLDCLSILLPSGRKLYYNAPALGQNEWGRPTIAYAGMDQTSKNGSASRPTAGSWWKTACRPSPGTAWRPP